jgi:hypothetical protein
MESFVGREVEAITLTHFDGEFTEALTDNYLKLQVPGQHSSNELVRLPVIGVRVGALVASQRIA